jgi:hypothetical protein
MQANTMLETVMLATLTDVLQISNSVRTILENLIFECNLYLRLLKVHHTHT